MENQLLNQQLHVYRSRMDEIVKDLHGLTHEIGHAELLQTVDELRSRLHDPFMFVIVGEVKAGKSSFINALLNTGRDICAVSPAPMTDTIQQIMFGEQETITSINPFLKKITLPVEILREIAIVDTPGTNTIVAHHQEITERFIPSTDLIVFVFEAKNPYRQSAWDFFDYIHADWRKKVIFVLQQKDLLNAEDLAINVKGVEDFAAKKGMNDVKIFSVSAKMEQSGQREESGFGYIRNYIAQNITGGKAPLLKLKNNISTSQNIGERIGKGLLLRREQFVSDTAFRKDIRQTLDNQEVKSKNYVDILVENILNAYDRTTGRTEQELADGLSFGSILKRSFSSIFSKQASAKEWLEGLAKNLDTQLHAELRNRLNDGVADVADSIQQMAKMIDLKIKNSSTTLKDNYEIFSDIADRRSNVLRDLQDAFSKFMSRSDSFTDESLFPNKKTLTPNLATGSGIAVVGVILAAVTHSAVFDITGGILTTVGLLFAGVSVGIQRRKILSSFQQEIAKGRAQLQVELDDRLKTYVKTIKQRIDDNFVEFDAMLANEELQINSLTARHQHIELQMRNLESEL